MKKVGIITFHAAHNYGSVLQAYALKNIVSDLGCETEIINFRTERQKDQYTPLTKRKGLKYILKNAYFLFNYKTRNKKYLKFESFINEKLVNKSQIEYSSLEELKNNIPEYNYYISGSDQIWNTVPNDADMAYFLPFVKEGTRIAYAPSFGQIGDIDCKEEIAQYILKYDFLSVREKFGQSLIEELTGRKAPILIDPTLVLDSSKWNYLIGERLVEGDYLFFYTLFATPEMIKMVKLVSQSLNLPVVISNISNQYEIFSGFNKIRDAGPEDFLSLIKYAKFVCVTSFHGTVFSILMNKPFFALNGLNDNRIRTLLETTGLTSRAVDLNNITEKLTSALEEVDYVNIENAINEQKEIALDYLKKALNIEE